MSSEQKEKEQNCNILHLSESKDGDEAEEEVKENIVKTLSVVTTMVVGTMVLTTVQIAKQRL